MHSNFEPITAQILLDNFRTGNFEALVELRYFVCKKYINQLLENHPNDEILDGSIV